MLHRALVLVTIIYIYMYSEPAAVNSALAAAVPKVLLLVGN